MSHFARLSYKLYCYFELNISKTGGGGGRAPQALITCRLSPPQPRFVSAGYLLDAIVHDSRVKSKALNFLLGLENVGGKASSRGPHFNAVLHTTIDTI